MKVDKAKKAVFVICLVCSALPMVGTASALILGILFSLLLGNPWPSMSSLWSKKMLQVSVFGLGFGLGNRFILLFQKFIYAFFQRCQVIRYAPGYFLSIRGEFNAADQV